MSRYVHLELSISSLDDLVSLLVQQGHPVERGVDGQIMLQGSLECTGEPVDVRLPPGTCDAVEDFGFVRRGESLVLVCSDVDRDVLERRLLAPLRQAFARQKLHIAARELDMEVDETVQADGTRRLVLRRRSGD